MKQFAQPNSQNPLWQKLLPKLAYIICLLLLIHLLPALVSAQVSPSVKNTTKDHSKQVIGYITQWGAWKDIPGLIPKGSLNQLNVDYSQYTILNFSFFGVAVDGSLHSGDSRNKNIYMQGEVQQPAPLLYDDIYSSWDKYLIYGELDILYYVGTGTYAYELGYRDAGGGWENVNTGEKGAFPLAVPKRDGAKGLLALCKEKGVKAMASIGGWSMCKHYGDVAADPAKRKKFTDDCKRLIALGFDGIDLDWEYPGNEGMNFVGQPRDYTNFAILVEEIRAAIGTSKLITSCFSAVPAKLGGFDWPRLSRSVDYFNMMTYDYNGGWSNKAGHNSPLYDYPGAEFTGFSLDATTKGVKALGIPLNKVNLGVGFYGRGVVTNGAASLNTPTVKRQETVQPDGPISTSADFTNWAKEVWDGTPNYNYIVANTSNWTEHWDDVAKVPYKTNGNFFLSYDNERSVGEKAQYIKDNQLGGVIVWSVYGDWFDMASSTQAKGKLIYCPNTKAPLVNKINEVFATGSPGNQAPTVSISSPLNNATFTAGTNINISANASDNDGSITKVEFFQGSTKLGEDITAPYSYTWNNVVAGNYSLTAKATDNGGKSTTSTVISIIVNGTGNNLPTVSITSPASGASVSAGVITIAANATDSDGSVAKVEFYNGNTKIGESTTSPFGISWTATAGSYVLKAIATDNKNAVGTSATVSITVTTGSDCSSSKRVVGYMPSWQGSAQEIEYEKLSHIIYAFIRPTTTGGLTSLENPQKLRDIVSLGHAKGVKISIAVGGWSDLNNADFQSMAANASYRATFINNLSSFIQTYELDGVDLDWEYPREGNDPANFATLMSELGSSLHSKGKILTAAVSAQGYYADGILSSVFSSVDFLNLMAYDGGDGASHSPYSYAESSLNYWLGRGLPASKAVLGVPFYGRPSWKTYATLLSEGANPTQDVFNGTYYNGTTTIKAKAQLALQRASGIMIWELSQDVHNINSLLRAINEVIKPCSGNGGNNAPIVNITSPSNNTSIQPGATVTIVASASDSDGSIAKVEFFANSSRIGEKTASPYSIAWTPGNGDYQITAIATDNKGASTTSGAVRIVVGTNVCTDPAWNATSVYTGTNRVSYNGNTYQAKWWTQGENPAQNSGPDQVWKLIGTCGGGTTNQSPSVSISLPNNGTSFTAPASITINAAATDADGSVAKVEFFQGSVKLGEDTSFPYSFSWSNVAKGTYSLTAKATDDKGASATSVAINVIVNDGNTGGSCSGVPAYAENGGYIAGSKVQSAGKLYECKPYPYSGWCNGAAWAYGPGSGTYWQDAWTLVGSCSASARVASLTSDEAGMVLYPTEVSGDMIHLEVGANVKEVKVFIKSMNGNKEHAYTFKNVQQSIDVKLPSLPKGMSIIRIVAGDKVYIRKIITVNSN